MAFFDFEKYTPHSGWHESVEDDLKAVGALIGFDIERLYFTGFWSQGDGACFEGSLGYAKGASAAIREYAPHDTVLHDIADRWTALQKRNFYAITGQVRQRGRYHHSGCTSFDFEDSRHGYGWTSAAFDEDEAVRIVRDLMDWAYNQLKNEYEYQQAYSLADAHLDLTRELAGNRAETLALVRAIKAERKQGRSAAVVICAALMGRIRQLLASRETMRAERAAIADNFRYWLDGQPVSLSEFKATYF